jgi:hypothetical protein
LLTRLADKSSNADSKYGKQGAQQKARSVLPAGFFVGR